MGGVFANVALAAPVAPVAGDLIKMTCAVGAGINDPCRGVYYYDGAKRYVFPMENIYKTWYSDFSNIVTISPTEIGNIQIGGVVKVRPGTWLVKITTDPKVYAVENGVLRWIDSEARASKLYGAEWYKKVIDLRDDLFPYYTVGAPISSDYHPVGTLIKYANSSQVYYIDSGNVKRPIASEAAMTANLFQSKFVVTTDITYADGSSITKKEPSLTNVAGSSVAVATGDVTVSLAADTPASSTVVAGQAIADLAHFTFTNGGSSEVKITTVNLKRIGVSADSTPSSVYLYEGNSRLTDAASVSSGNINFNDAAGIFTLPAGGSKTIAVKANIATGTSGQTVGVKLESAAKVVASPTATIVGTFPINGNIHTVATATLATVDFNSSTTPSTATITAQSNYVMWQNIVTVGNRYVWMKSFKLRQVGSVYNTDLGNFKLFVDGEMVGDMQPSLDSNGYVMWDLSASPKKLETGSRTIKMVGDILSGANRNFSFSLRTTGDALFVDSEYNQPVLATANSSSFSARTSGTQTIDTGSLTFTKRTDSPSGNVVKDAAGVTLAKFDVKAFGENMKVENLKLRIDETNNVTTDDDDTSGPDGVYTLRNGAIYLDGVQVGSTAAIAGDGDATQAYTEYTFGSSFIVNAGQTRVMEVRADIYDSDTTNDIDASDALQVEIVEGSSNVQRMTSLGYGSYPAAVVEGNDLTVATGSLAVGKNASYSSHTVVVPKYAYKIGSYNISANSTEGATITSVVVDFDSVADAFDASDDITNMYIVLGSYTSTVKSTITDTSNTYSTNVAISAGQTLALDIYADIASSAYDGDATADTATSSVTVSYTTSSSATSTSASEVSGQTITAGAGSLTIALDGGSPLNRIVAGNQSGVEAARYRFTATNDTYYIDEVDITVSSATVASVINSVDLYDGSTKLGTAYMVGDDGDSGSNNKASFYGLNVKIDPAPAAAKILTVKYNLAQIGVGGGNSQSNAAAQIDRVKYHDSAGTITTSTTDYNANELYVYKSIPTVNHVDLSNTSALVNGTATDLYKFTVTASAQGDIALKQFILTTTWSDGGTVDTLEVESLKLYEDGVDVSTNVTIQDQSGNSVESSSGLLEDDEDLTVSWDTTKESLISAGTTKTYLIRGTPQGFRMTGSDTVGDSVSFYLAGDTTHNSTKVYLNGTFTAATLWGLHTAAAATGSGTLYQFIWSDYSANPHVVNEDASSSGDWANSYKVLNLDLAGETWSK